MNTRIQCTALVLMLGVALTSKAAEPGGELLYPAQIPDTTWLRTHQRLCYGVDAKNFDEVIRDGTNVICGGTNAAGIGFAGGPFILGKNGEVIDIMTGAAVPEQTLKELRGRVEMAHAKGAKVLGEVIRFYMTPWIQAEHPDWQVIDSPGGKPITVEQLKDIHVMGCWNSPYGDWFIQSQVALVKRLDWDGYNMDGFGCWAHCFCPYCTAAYQKDTGKDIPATGDVNNAEFRRYLKWRLDRYTHYVARWTAALKAVKPDFVTAPWSTGPGRWWHWTGAPAAEGTDAMHRVLDAPCLELLWDFPPDQGSNLLPAFTCRYYRGLTGDRPAWILPYLSVQGQFNMQAPRAECDLREMTVITNGCLAGQGHWQQNEGASLAHFNQMLEEREPFTRGAKSLKWAAMLVGESSRLLYGLPGVRTEVPLGAWIGSGVDTHDISKLVPGQRRMPAHMESAVGVFRAMMEDHLPLDIIIEPDVENLETLKQYKVLILPNAACLSAKADETIRAFVKAGGGLVSMHESSMCNEYGDHQKDFALSDVFGAHFKATEDYSARWPNYPKWTELYVGISGPDLHPIADDPVVRSNYRRGSDRLQYIGWMTNVEVVTGATKLGRRLTLPIEWPFIVLNQSGEGRSAYFAADMGQAYFIAPYQYQRRLITNAVRWSAGANKPPVRVEAPLCVQAAFYTQNNGARKIVHLLNEINTTANRALAENNPSQREETVPLLNIKVALADPKAKSAFQEPGHQQLELKKTDEGVEVIVPRLDVHTMVVFETPSP
ncbi:MAG: Trehalose utilization [Phycisphaerales bacterium]|nr:Trehalose utilization [Phycisphaerales bacterium]